MIDFYKKLKNGFRVSKVIFLSIVIFAIPVIIKSEFLICRLDQSNHNKKEAVGYVMLSPKAKLDIHELYKNTVYRYQFPTVKAFYKQFSQVEKKEYDTALRKKNGGLFEFIKNKVEAISGKKYSLVWTPTVVFEVYGLHASLGLYNLYCDADDLNSCPLIPVNVLNGFKYWASESMAKNLDHYLDEDFSLRDQDLVLYFITTDYVLNQYQQNSKFIEHVKKSNVDHVLHLLNKMLIQLKNKKDGERSIYRDEFLPIIKQCLFLEQDAYKNNQFLLFRGTNGYEDRFDRINAEKNDGWSYAYSLFAGSLFDRFGIPARTLDFMAEKEMGYVLCIDIIEVFQKNVFDLSGRALPEKNNFFIWLPNITTVQGLFGIGEYFHPRLWSSYYDKNNPVVAYWLSCLSKAIVVNDNSAGKNKQNALHKEIDMQKKALLNSALQEADALFLQEADEFEALFKMMNIK